MKNRILIIALIIILGAIAIYLIFFNGSNESKENKSEKTETVEITNLYNDDENIEWSNVEGYDINLDGSIKITEGGVYTLTGTISDGLILVDTEDEVKLILDNVSITSSNTPAILVENAKLVEIELKEGSENYLEDGSSYISEYADYEGVIYSKDDLIISGTGKLTVKANLGDAIVSKDNLKIIDGNYVISAADDAIKGKDSLYILNGEFNIMSSGDGLKSTNEEDENLGYIYIVNGTFDITSGDDGIQATTNLIIENGTFNIETSGSSDNSLKGIKADKDINIYGGEFNLNTAEDSIHSNTNIVINGGNYTINSGDDGIHADEVVEINDGTLNIIAHEGIEGTYIKINGGTININASDDGINAAKKVTKYTPTVEINGGNITIKMGSGDTDGIDSNGNIYINGGTINITGNSPFDYDGEAKYSSGTLIINGVETTTITNQFMGGPNGGMQGQRPEGEMPNGGQPGRENRVRY